MVKPENGDDDGDDEDREAVAMVNTAVSSEIGAIITYVCMADSDNETVSGSFQNNVVLSVHIQGLQQEGVLVLK